MISRLSRQFVFLFAISGFAFCFAGVGRCEEPQKVSACQVKNDPATYNHKLIEVTGFVSHGFEDFGLFDPTCATYPYIWLEYGGKAKSGTMYCCGVTADRSRPRELVIENIAVPLVKDEGFKAFDNLIHLTPSSIVHATVVGRFFSGKERHYPNGVSWGGYGHMGCCSMLAIQQVISVDPHDRQDLDYGASPDQPKMDKAGCGFKSLFPLLPYEDLIYEDLIEAQHRAEVAQPGWEFDDPQRVASEALARLVKIDQTSTEGMKQTRTSQGRIVYEWIPAGERVSYMVVVSRPYWLSYYSKDPTKIAWVVIAAYESSCGKNNTVQLVK
jgi:hypothetical protein